MQTDEQRLRVLCVARHAFLSDHLARYFSGHGIDVRQTVGLEQAVIDARAFRPDVIIAEYELLATLSLAAWERDDVLSRTSVLAVSLTRRPHEAHLLDVSGIAGFLYLPLLDRAAAVRLLSAAARSSRTRYVSAAVTTSPGIQGEVAAPR